MKAILIVLASIVSLIYCDEGVDPIEDSKFTKELEKLWEDFDSEFYYTFEIPSGKKFTFYQEILKVPSTIKGVYITDDEHKQKINLQIVDENWYAFYSENSHQGVFDVTIRRKGNYRLVFDNKMSSKDQKVSLLMSSGQNKLLNATQVETTHEKIRSLDSYVKTVLKDQEFMNHRFRERVKSKYIIKLIN